MAGRNTYDLTFINGSTKRHFNIERDANGTPLIKVGSQDNETAGVGQFDTIRLESQHRGSGQIFGKDPLRFSHSTGWQFDAPGKLRTVGLFTNTLVSNDAARIDTALATKRGGLCTIDAEGGVSAGYTYCITPMAIWQEDGSHQVDAPAACIFTGSFARFGDRVFFGIETTTTRVSAGFAVKTVSGAWNAPAAAPAAALQGSFFCTVGSRLFRARYAANVIYMSWTDETGTDTPTWSTEYPLSTTGEYIADIAPLGPHCLIAVGRDGTTAGKIVVVDTDGNFTDVVPHGVHVQPGVFVAMAGGMALLQQGRPRLLFMVDPMTAEPVGIPALANEDYAETDFDVPVIGGGIDNYLFTVMSPSTEHWVIQARLDADGWSAGTIIKPSDQVSNHRPIAILPFRWSNGLNLKVLTHGTAADEIRVLDYGLWDLGRQPASVGSHSRSFVTSRWTGAYWGTKMFNRVRFRLVDRGTTGSVLVNILVDGVSVYSVSHSEGVVDIPLSSLGRDIQIQLVGSSGIDNHMWVVLPFEIENYFVPDQQDIIRVPLVLGSEEPRAGGGLQKKSRGDAIQQIEAMITGKLEWTLEWKEGSGRPNWTVIPLSYVVAETDDAPHGARGRSVAWLTFKRTG